MTSFFHAAAEFGLTRALSRAIVAVRFRQGGTEIKSFSLNRDPDLAVNDKDVGVVIPPAPREEPVVLPHSDPWIFSAEAATSHCTTLPNGMELIQPAKEHIENTPAIARTTLVPQLARMMTSRLVQALFAQRTSLLDTQTQATQRMTELEERLVDAQAHVQKKMAAYETRIAELEQQIAVKEEENRELMRANVHLTKKAYQTGGASTVRSFEPARRRVFAGRVAPVRSIAVLHRSVPAD